MIETLVKKSDIKKIKYKFFLIRVVIYFSFLLIPLWLQKTVQLNLFFQSCILLCYMMFMGGQWYLLGKEIDHRLKIYYRANSSMDRFLYRSLMGSTVFVLLFNVFHLFSNTISEILFWSLFTLLGLFYSWPTRGKIIEESMSDQFAEFKFLDSFEKTVLYLSFAMFIVSLPEIALFQNIDALKLYFDPREHIHFLQWNFLNINYLPFLKYSKLFNLAWSYHFYFYGMAFYLIGTYGVLRFFLSRRLSILGVFAAISTWSVAKILDSDFMSIFTTTYPVLWLWTLLWSTKSSTYRSGLFVGLLNFFGVLINSTYIFLFPIQLLLTYFLFLPDKTKWYKLQWIKYNGLGAFLCCLAFFSHLDFSTYLDGMNVSFFLKSIQLELSRKAFFILSPIGLLITLFAFLNKKSNYFKSFNIDLFRFKELLLGIVVIFFIGFVFNKDLIRDFSIIWIFVFFSLLPLEWIFQSISRLRSKRNIIYTLYILVCLLDSHFEGRLRIVGKMFLSDEILKYINQM